jgi:hypothetical protein
VWLGQPTLGDVTGVFEATVNARKITNQRVHCISLIDAETELPETDVREAMTRAWSDLMASCASFDIVIMGPSVKATLKRSVVRGMAIVSRISRMVFTHDTPESAIERLRVSGVSAPTLAKVSEAIRTMREQLPR